MGLFGFQQQSDKTGSEMWSGNWCSTQTKWVNGCRSKEQSPICCNSLELALYLIFFFLMSTLCSFWASADPWITNPDSSRFGSATHRIIYHLSLFVILLIHWDPHSHACLSDGLVLPAEILLPLRLFFWRTPSKSRNYSAKYSCAQAIVRADYR